MIKFDLPPLFQPRVEKKFRPPPPSSLNPPPKEKFQPPHLLLDNSNTGPTYIESHAERVTQRERERERGRERQTETERQRGRETYRDRDRETEKERGRERSKHTKSIILWKTTQLRINSSSHFNGQQGTQKA